MQWPLAIDATTHVCPRTCTHKHSMSSFLALGSFKSTGSFLTICPPIGSFLSPLGYKGLCEKVLRTISSLFIMPWLVCYSSPTITKELLTGSNLLWLCLGTLGYYAAIPFCLGSGSKGIQGRIWVSLINFYITVHSDDIGIMSLPITFRTLDSDIQSQGFEL